MPGGDYTGDCPHIRWSPIIDEVETRNTDSVMGFINSRYDSDIGSLYSNREGEINDALLDFLWVIRK